VTKKYVALARVSSREPAARRVFPRHPRGCLAALRRAYGRNHRQAVQDCGDCHQARRAAGLQGVAGLRQEARGRIDRLCCSTRWTAPPATSVDYVELERLESEHDLAFISVSQPTENTPAGRMQRRMLASMASFYTETTVMRLFEKALGASRRKGWYVGHAPWMAIRNVRIDGRALWRLIR